MRTLLLALFISCFAAILWADGPLDNIPQNVRRIPKLGIEVPTEVREELQTQLDNLLFLRLGYRESEFAQPHWNDVLIFYIAVNSALRNQEFFDPKEFKIAKELLAEGHARARALAKGEAPWLTKPGSTVRGYVSEIDGSIQPYGLVIPAGYSRELQKPQRLDVWFHGRGETLSELNFLYDRPKNPGQFTPAETFVLHPYGRYCNANKFAGEIDTFEALAHVQKTYLIDENRMNVRGFSMGGAACWQFATHYSDRWCAAAPGAGFSETPDFLKVFQKETLQPKWWEKKLWHWYDCTDYAENLTYLPIIAYSGEKDIQKQAADIMATAMQKAGLELKHVIGPNTGHAYEAEAKNTINAFMDAANKTGRNPLPNEIKLTTYTLRYNSMYWASVQGLQQHWERATLAGKMVADKKSIELTTSNISQLRLEFGTPASPTALPIQGAVTVVLDGTEIQLAAQQPDREWSADFEKTSHGWQAFKPATDKLRKQPGLQGPIDDAFLAPFLFVKPGKTQAHPTVQQWVDAEYARAVEHWRRQFRGTPRETQAADATEEDLKKYNLILWGDATSHELLEKITAALPIKWNANEIRLPDAVYPADKHVLLGIYPNPLNRRKYIVLNSSFTYRDYAYLNNARQVPMLPDWAVIDITTPANPVWPGKVVDADFFGESWEFKRTKQQESP